MLGPSFASTPPADFAGVPADGPFVSCIMPTRDHRPFVAQAIEYFLRQDYPNRELLIVDDGARPVTSLIPPDARIRYVRLNSSMLLGEKRNLCCEMANGPLIAHWDDDDWYAPWRLSYQISGMLEGGFEISGSPRVLFYAPFKRAAWEYTYAGARPWVAGATLCYTKNVWHRSHFAAVETGEDALFAWHNPLFRAHVPRDTRFCVNIIHPANASPKLVSEPGWNGIPITSVLELLGSDEGFYRTLALEPPFDVPLVTCVMPTRDRRDFARQAIGYFLRQDYPKRELIVVDDGSDRVVDLVQTGDRRLRYVHLPEPRSIGVKRNFGCELARGEIIVQWDDDDWYATDRVSRQVARISEGSVEVTGIGWDLLLDLSAWQFWSSFDEGQVRNCMYECAGGTLAFTKTLWRRAGGYPDVSLGEDFAFLDRAVSAGARVEYLPNGQSFICVRHTGNTWQLDLAATGWRPVAPPEFLSSVDVDYYQGLALARSPSAPR